MILQGSLRIEYKGQSFLLTVKTIIKNGLYYFYVSDKDAKAGLLEGETLELTYSDSFCTPDTSEAGKESKVPAEIVSAVEKMLADNKELWYY